MALTDSTPLNPIQHDCATRCQRNRVRASRLDYMARSRRQCSAPCSPRASTIDCARSAKSRRLRVTLGLSSPVLECIPTFHRSCGDRLTRRLPVEPGCRWRAAPGHAPRQRAATDSDVGSVRLGSAADAASGTRHEAFAAPGLPAFHRRVNGDDSNAAAFNAPESQPV